jgi:hypothetical protein
MKHGGGEPAAVTAKERPMPAQRVLSGSVVAAGQRPPRLFKMFAALSAANEAILRINSKEKLLQQVCEAALQSGNFLSAVILLREPGTETLKAVAGAGDDAELRPATLRKQ